MTHETFVCGDLTAVIGDNAESGAHRAGYNGLWSLKHRTGKESLFVPAYAGMNHEHIFDGHADFAPEVIFEPRHAAMRLEKISPTEAELHQPPTPHFHLESRTRLKLVEPHYVDFAYRCRPHQHAFPYGYIGLFWASYINGPDDKSMYFRGGLRREPARWVQLCTPRHNDESTAVHRDDKTDLRFREGFRDTLFKNLSPLVYELPFFYGLFQDHLCLLMFDRSAGIRLTHSPSGGGYHAARETTNPAWDFQYVLASYEVGREYGFNARLVLREKCSRGEVLEEYERWRKQAT